jgi:hypothetical protein
VHLSTHYYVLSLSEGTNSFYECFRDTVIDVRNEGFPLEPSAPTRGGTDDEGSLQDLLRTVDQRFGEHYHQEPLGLVVIGERRVQSVFASVTVHEDAIIGHIDGDYTTTSPRDVGKIVWPVVKQAMSGVENEAMRELEIAKSTSKVAFGLDAVGRLADVAVGSTLLVEEDYQVQGSIRRIDQTTVISGDVDVRDAIDNVIDAVIEKVLEASGSVFFLRPGSLKKHERIALILHGTEQVG